MLPGTALDPHQGASRRAVPPLANVSMAVVGFSTLQTEHRADQSTSSLPSVLASRVSIFQASRSDLAVSAASHGPADTAFKMTGPKPASTRNARQCKCRRTDGMARGENLRWGLMASNRTPTVRLPTHLGSGGQTSPVLPFQRDSGSRLSISSLDLVDPRA